MANILGGPILQPRPEPQLREFGDSTATRKAIFDNALKAAQSIQPTANQLYTLSLHDVNYTDPEDYSLADQKKAILSGQTLGRRLRGTWRMTDNVTGDLVDKKTTTLGRVPYMTPRGTFIDNGTEYAIVQQARLRAGIFSREKANGEIESHCFAGHVLILTEHGPMPIRDIVNKKLQVRVWSYDFETKNFALKPVVGWFRNKIREKLGKGVLKPDSRLPSLANLHHPSTLWVTPSHKVFDIAGNKQEISKVVQVLMPEEKPSNTQVQLLCGSVLGDGHISPKGAYEEVHCLAQKEYIEFKTAILGELLTSPPKPHVSNGNPQLRIHGSTWSYLKYLRYVCYSNNVKTVSDEWLALMDERALAFWFCDDGSSVRVRNQHGQSCHLVVNLATQGLDTGSVDRLMSWLLTRWGLKAKRNRQKIYEGSDIGWYISINGEDGEQFLDLIAPYCHPSMSYKFGPRPMTGLCVDCGKEVDRRRNTCNRCCLRRHKDIGPAISTARHRFGGTAAVKQLLEDNVVPKDYNLGERWDSRLPIGSRVSEMLADNKTRLELASVPFEYSANETTFAETKVAFDIEVADTHNYIANGVLVSNCNAIPGKGVSHRYLLDPAKGTFQIHLGQSNIPLMPLVRALGATDKQLREAWGDKILAANYSKDDPVSLNKLYMKLIGKKDDGNLESRTQAIVDTIRKMELDPEVTQRTLGKGYKNLDLEPILHATSRLLAISRGEAETDDRDHLAYQQILGPEDIIAERISKDAGHVRRTLLHKSTWKKNLSPILPSALDKQIASAIHGTGLAQGLEEVNLAEILDKQSRITRMGEGALPSIDSIPDEARSVSPSHLGYFDSVRTPESLRVGVDLNIASGARKGNDGRLYAPFLSVKTGRQVLRSPQDVADLAIAFPGEMQKNSKRVVAMKAGQLVHVPRDQVDLVLPNFESAFSSLSNMVPFKSASKGQRVAMGSRMLTQALPLLNPEAPLVQAGIPGKPDRSYEEEYGKHMGAIRAEKEGRVLSVSADGVKVKYSDGTTQTHELYNAFPLARKTFVEQTPTVQPGDAVKPGQLLARSNYTDESGTTALGVNARVGFIPKGANTFEDAVAISESFAKRLSSVHAYKHGLDYDDKIKTGKKAFVSLFPSKYSRTVLDNMDDDGVIKQGTVVNFGDPLIVAARERELARTKLHKRGTPSFSDVTEEWTHHTPGVVTDVVKTDSGAMVMLKAVTPMEEADKLCYSADTEVLLKDKTWKRVSEITLTDKVMSRAETHELWTEAVAPVALHKYPHSGRMLHVKTKHSDLLVTEDHALLVSYTYKGPTKLVKAKELAGKAFYMYNDAGCFLVRREDTVWRSYSGYVYCITLPRHHVLYVRRNGKECWSGNSGRYGNKGIVTIIPDDKMPIAADGKPLEALLNPLSVISRSNPSQIIEAVLGKIAAKTGKPYKIADFDQIPDLAQFASDELQKHGMTDLEDVIDPETGHKIPQVLVGNMFLMKLHHMAADKLQGRSTGGYSATGEPTKGGEAGCFVGSQLVDTIDGLQPLGRIVREQFPAVVRTWDDEIDDWDYRQVIDWFTQSVTPEELIEVVLDNGEVLVGTKTHVVILESGERIPLGDLQPGHNLRSTEGQICRDDPESPVLSLK